MGDPRRTGDVLEDLFHRARRLRKAEWDAFLAEACGIRAVRDEVRALLDHLDHSAEEFDGLLARLPVLLEEAALDADQQTTTEEMPSLGGYRVLEELGSGGMGVVYLAEQTRLHRRVALKVMRRGRGGEGARFEIEQRTLAALGHDGIATIYEAGVEGDCAYFAMEYVAGEPLLTHCASRNLSLRARVALFQRVCLAVGHAHRRGCVHRDLKPTNILVTSEGVPKVIDFGVAAWFAVGESGPTASDRVPLAAGTLPYVPPEHLRSLSFPIDPRVDVYALGVTLCELITGVTPFAGGSVDREEVVARILDHGPDSLDVCLARCTTQPSRRDRRVLQDLDAIIAKATGRSPEDRYAHAGELGDELSRALSDAPIRARPSSVIDRAARFARREPAKAVLWSLLLLGGPALLSLAAIVGPRALSAWRQERELERERRIVAADLMREVGDFRNADRAFRDLVPNLREDPEALGGVVWTLLSAGRPHDALAELDEANAPRDSGLQWLRVECLKNLGRREEAQALADSLPEPRAALDLVLAGNAMLAGALELPEDRAAAVALLKKAVLHASRPRLSYWASYCKAAGAAQDVAAVNECVEALSFHWPNEIVARYRCGVALRAVKNLKQAEVQLRAALRLDSNRATTRNSLGNVLADRGDLAEALMHLDRAIAIAPQWAVAHYNRGNVLVLLDRREEAVAEYRTALQLDPGLRDARLNLGGALVDLGRSGEAIPELLEFAPVSGRSFRADWNLTLALHKLRRLSEAEQRCRDCFSRAPDDPEVLCELGRLALEQGRFAEALPLLRRGHEIGSPRPSWRHPSERWVRECEAAIQRAAVGH